MKIFLTGGSGFIGRNILEHLGGVYEILAPKHSELELTDTDAVYKFLEANPVDVVIHAANIGGNRRQQHVTDVLSTNLKNFFNLVRARKFFGRMIMLGSGAEYDKRYPIVQVKERDSTNRIPADDYGLYKYVCAQFALEVDFITHLRLFSVIGKYEDREIRFVSNTIVKVLKGLPVEIYRNIVFDYLSIDDFIRVLNACLCKKPESAVLNVGSGMGIDLKTVAEKIMQEVGIEVPVVISNTGDSKEYTCNIDLLNHELGSFSFESIEQSIAELVSHL